MSALPLPGAHGGDGARVAAALGTDPAAVLDLSASLNPVAPDPSEVVAKHVEAIGRYPDAGAATDALAAAMAVDPDRLLLTNGGAEAIALVATELGRGWADPCDFALYRRHLPELDPGGPRFRSNPHNPTGRLAGEGDEAAVWDEAFFPLATGRWTRGDRAIVVGSLTKLLACPGLRVGYVLAPETGLIGRLARRQPRWAVNGLVAAALPDLLATADLVGWAATVAELRKALVDLLQAHGLEPEPSHANYVLCARAGGLRERLAPYGVVVRDCASFGLPGQARVAVPDNAGLARLEAALEDMVRRSGRLCPPGEADEKEPSCGAG
ncbi:MAG: aminotransferase class I/II-fold pyridoxal phosphate-dependent enzyme [Actinomycetota bacterium]|nr:aminotransferase class I/II-fold pyridoxal phosphate-dependent enzyme [Actinomycetota bacterium]